MQDIDVELVEEDGEDNMPIDGTTISTGKKRTKTIWKGDGRCANSW
jgi:hypothetical protein